MLITLIAYSIEDFFTTNSLDPRKLYLHESIRVQKEVNPSAN